jgi:LuxR family maltose regulon positive regulatory protein
VLVSAPAGYGKSMLVSHWIEARAEPCAWLSLDDTDSDVDVFLQYLLAAIEAIHPDACPNTRLLTRAAELPPMPVVANTLINELDAVTAPFFLVLDDYHQLASSSAAHELLRRVLAHPPPSMHLILISRRDPPLGLTALRAQGRLNEIRLAELRFTAAETRSLLASVMGLTASDATVANLQQQMEGWAVGLRLATLALRPATDPDSALRTLRGGIQDTREYLLREVVEGQPREVRDWLLKTSILDRFCPALCEALCMAEDATAGDGLNGEAFVRALQECNSNAGAITSRATASCAPASWKRPSRTCWHRPPTDT